MKTILIADDEANLRMLARITLDDPEYLILEAEDGSTALSLAKSAKPDLIVLDWMMPGLTGIEVARTLKQDPSTEHIPIIMLTAKGQEEDRLQGRTAGVQAYLIKPFSPLELLGKIQELWQSQFAESTAHKDIDVTSDLPELTTEVQKQLDTSNSQLALYARDLKRIVDVERQKSRALAEANARLQILDQLKTDFLSFISHELRTPLNVISAIDMVDPHGDPQEQREVICIIRRGYQQLENFIEKGLEYFNWLAQNKATPSETSDLAMVIKEILDQHPDLQKPEVELVTHGLETLCPVRCTNLHLTRVVETLLDNALKFSEQDKHIDISLQVSPGTATLTIADKGRGFPPELAGELFHPFTITNSLHHSQGSGLSLAIAGTIVEAYGGKIRAESQGPGYGASFIVDFPMLS